MKIFLGDLVHSWEKVSTWTFPLNIGFIAEYAKAHVDAKIETRLFKDPARIINAIESEDPDVVALSYYVWNTNLNNWVFELAKTKKPGVLTIGGGPRFTSLNANETEAAKFMRSQPFCDAYVINQGERGFAKILNAFLKLDGRVDAFKGGGKAVPGCMIFPQTFEQPPLIGEKLDPIQELDDIPSPYLSGALDEFFDGPYVPIIETNRSCPYRCTFCAWGIGTQKLSRFSLERVISEIRYIASRCQMVSNFFIGDANFGILDRDWEIARELRACHEARGFPGHVTAQWNKTRPDRVKKTAVALGNLAEVGASMQSLNSTTLAAIKRKNMTVESIIEILDELKISGVDIPLFTELIVGLPEETYESHLDSIRAMIDLGAEVFNYNLHLLPGTEMDTAASRESWFKRTGWRLHDNCWGIYAGKTIFEGQEVVLETSTMTFGQLRSFRFVHFLLQFMWGRRWYFDFLNLFKSIGVHPVDTILEIATAARQDDGVIGELYESFCRDHDLEKFDTFDELAAYWSQENHFERLRNGSYGKLNYEFSFRIVFEYRDAFNTFLQNVANKMVEKANVEPGEKRSFREKCANVIKFSNELWISIGSDFELVERKTVNFDYDVLTWRKNGYQTPLSPATDGHMFACEFFVPPARKKLLETQLKQFKSANANQMLRQMSVDTSSEQFFYDVKTASDAA